MKRAFTLIELLIVIAIIAILALIAVPNFLEAQVRAKVSRVHADQRTIATAVEAYTVDWGRPLIGFNEGQSDYNIRKPHAYNLLTTPVAYLSTIPRDPFSEHGQQRSNGTFRDWTQYPYQYMRDPTSAMQAGCLAKGVYWMMYSVGPMKTNWPPWMENMIAGLDEPTNVYDPSNGTMSKGFICRTNKGPYTGDTR